VGRELPSSIHDFGDCIYPVPRSHLPAWPLSFPHFSTIVLLVLLTDHYHINISAVFPLILAATRLQNFTYRVDEESSHPDYTSVISVPQFRSVVATYPGYGLNLVCNFRAPNLADLRLDRFRSSITEKC